MKSLSKQEVTTRDELIAKAQEAKENLQNNITEFNGEVQDLYAQKVNPFVEKLNEALNELRNWCEERHCDAENYYDEKSEKWQQGDKGEQYGSWRDSFAEAAAQLDEVEVDSVEELDMPEVDLETATNIADSPEEM